MEIKKLQSHLLRRRLYPDMCFSVLYDRKESYFNDSIHQPNKKSQNNGRNRGKTSQKLSNPTKSSKTKADVFRSSEKLQSFKETFASAKVFSSFIPSSQQRLDKILQICCPDIQIMHFVEIDHYAQHDNNRAAKFHQCR